jgi:response regulator of citrate/malate metabolism
MNNVVLIIEDDDDLAFLISEVVRRRGLAAHRISQAVEIENAVIKDQPILILMDNHLVDGFGITFVSLIKRLCLQCQVVLMTADEKHVLRHFEGFEKIDGFLAKPFKTSDLDPYLSMMESRAITS